MKEELPSIHYTCKAATAAEWLPVYSWRVTYWRGGVRVGGMNMKQLGSGSSVFAQTLIVNSAHTAGAHCKHKQARGDLRVQAGTTIKGGPKN